MSRYKVLKKSFINGRLLYPGEEIEFIGVAGSNLQLIETGERITVNEDANAGGDNHGGSGGNADAELIVLQDQYQQLFGKKPHHNAGAEKLRADIDVKRKELGV